MFLEYIMTQRIGVIFFIDISNYTTLTIDSIKYKLALTNKKNQLLGQQVSVTKKIKS